MSITKAQVLATAKLARLHVGEDKVDFYISNLNKILQIIDELQEVNTDGVKPLVNVSEFELPLREDQVSSGNIEDLFSNAPKELYRHFAVPKVIE